MLCSIERSIINNRSLIDIDSIHYGIEMPFALVPLIVEIRPIRYGAWGPCSACLGGGKESCFALSPEWDEFSSPTSAIAREARQQRTLS
jgi:hypothetical protein